MDKIKTEYGIFTSNEITGQTAEEVFQEALKNKESSPQPSETEVLTNYLLDVDMRLVMVEMGLI